MSIFLSCGILFVMRGMQIILLFISLSCTKWSHVKSSNGIYQVSDVSAHIHSEKTLVWKIGKNRGAIVSKGFNFKVDIPKIDQEGRDILFREYGIDAWLFKISKISRGKKQHLDFVSFDFQNISRMTSELTLHIFYHAASVSDDFRRFHCPAFDHRYLINDIELNEDATDNFNLYVRRNQLIKGRIHRPSLAPIISSAGKSLMGKYIVEIALYNSKEKRIYTSFKKLSNTIEVSSEHRVSVPSCIGVKQELNPLPSTLTPSIRNLEIK